ncbi:DUF2510 domain-containing protein [Microlunatus speluncae]|uniref:DUF2510 domain-containing protein n=1 Tax=Microlunatus speluncae TaxID=2594267 RepID=UPI001266517E|nr:DUF2510 domain-containing protein [Microlunatus speluncae]
MTAGPGWYPDPDGTPGRLRYYDGRGWTGNVRPVRGGGGPSGNRGGGRRIGLLLGGLAVVLVIIVVGVVVFTRQNSSAFTNENLPTSTVTGWDDSSPSPDPSSAAPSETPTGSGRPVACDLAGRNELPDPPVDGRVHGGPLTFQRLPYPWSDPMSTSRFPYSRDASVQTQALPEKLPWEASAQVGVLTFDDHPDGEEATARLLQCLVTSDFYTSVSVTVAENKNTAIKLGSTPATQLDALLTFSHPELKTKGSKIRIVVVDTDPATYYFHAVPMERDDLIAELDAASRSLAVG